MKVNLIFFNTKIIKIKDFLKTNCAKNIIDLLDFLTNFVRFLIVFAK